MTIADYSCLMSAYAGDDPDQFELAVHSILQQTVAPAELVLVFDGPVHAEIRQTVDELKSSAASTIKTIELAENHGLWFALREGVLACSYPLIARMDADDYSHPSRIAEQLQALADDPDLDCVGTLVEEFVDSPAAPTSLVALPELHADIVQHGKRRNPLRHPTMLYRKEAVLAAGNYQRMPYFEDYDLYVRMVRAGSRFRNVQSPLVSVRVSPDFLQRRGGVTYLREMVRFRSSMLRGRDVGLMTFLVTTVQHAGVILMPNRMRTMIYNRFLRSAAHRAPALGES